MRTVAVVLLLAACHASAGRARVESDDGTTHEVQVIPWSGGEQLLLGQRRAPLSIKVSPASGSPTLIMGSEEIRAGDGIPVHMHLDEDEIIFVHAGDAIATVGGAEQTVAAGTTLYIPRGTWHGLRNATDAAGDAQMIWVFSAPGMDDYFRAIAHPDTVDDAAEEAKHGIRYQP